jgi:outer membrane protein OmpA-like peptidoglycan-associated protein
MRKTFWSLTTMTASLLTSAAFAQTGATSGVAASSDAAQSTVAAPASGSSSYGSGSSSDDFMDGWANGGAFYLGAKAGGNWLAESTHFASHTDHHRIDDVADYQDGYIGAVEGGFAFNSGLRLELEGSYRYNQADHFVVRGGSARGVMKNYAAMVNALYEIPLDSPIRPYIGAGAGYSDYAPDHVRGDNMPYPNYYSGDKWGFAWQAIGGVSYNIDDNIALSVEYRYFERLYDYPYGVRDAYESQSALIGVKYTFGEREQPVHEAVYTPPAPAPRPAAAPRNYLVFFDFNKSDLTGDARHIVDQAASNAKSGNVTQLNVTGYTDTVGSDAYNLRLSRRRAESVASELEAQGVPSSEIAIYAKGKHDLLVPTADGVREPQNRRVQIILGGGPNS